MAIRYIINDQITNTWFLIHQTYDSLIKYEENAFEKAGLPFQQFLVLCSIKLNNGPATSAAIANILDRHPNSISMIINRMKKDGLIQSVRSLKDRRALILKITPKGERKFKKAAEIGRVLPIRMLSVLSSEEISNLGHILSKTRENTFELRNIKDKVKDIDTLNNKHSITIFGK